MAITAPNYTQIPNEILDAMDTMTPAAFKVLIAICRRTFGWHKTRDVISLSQLVETTGLSRTAVQAGIMAAIERGLLERVKVDSQSFSYHLLVASDYQSTETTSSVSGTELVVSDYQELVVSDYSQKKELKKERKGGESEGNAPPPPPPPLVDVVVTEEPAVAIYEEIFDRALNPEQRAIVGGRVVDLVRWRRCCEDWKLNGYKAANLSGLLDRYGKPDPPPDAPRDRPTRRTGPPPAEKPGVTVEEARRLGAARKAEALKGLPSTL